MAMGVSRATVQRYFEPGYRENKPLDLNLAMELAKVFTGKGSPPIRQEEVLSLTGLPQIDAGPRYNPLSLEVCQVIAEAVTRIALPDQEPPADAVEPIARTLQALSVLYESDPAARHDPAQTRGALKALALRFGPPEPESRAG